MTNSLAEDRAAQTLGAFLKDRRQRLDAAGLGFGGRRRTPGLRREEVAQRAHISPTWYTWLEQGRGGAPSPRVHHSLAQALLLTAAERDHLFLLGLGHPPKPDTGLQEGISARLQRLLDSWPMTPATVATASWDIIGWNRAAQLALTDYAAMPASERNILRRIFLDPPTRAAQSDWEAVARFLVATFRAETTRAGETARAQALVKELSSASAEFTRMWRDNDVRTTGDGTKTIRHARVGEINFEFSSFAVDGRPDLKLMIYNPMGARDAEQMRRLLQQHDGPTDQR